MNILFVVNGLGEHDGASKQLVLTANQLSAKGYNVFVHTLATFKRHKLLHPDIKHIPPILNIKLRQLQWFTFPFVIRKIAKDNNIDVIISWRTNAGSYSTLATLGTNIKTIFCERSDPYMEPSNIHAITTYLASLSTGGVFQTPKARDYYKRLAPKAVVIPNPIDANVELPQIIEYSTRPKEIVFVGRMSIQQKRFDILFRTMKDIHKVLPEYKLRLYGGGKYIEKIKAMAYEMGLKDIVVFEGVVDNIIEKIKYSRLMLLTSDYEGIPNVVIEAFQAGVPVVTTDCSPGGCRVLIEDGKNGFITPFRDYKATAEKAIELLSDEKLANQFINNSRTKLQEFSPEIIFQKWDEYIKYIYNDNALSCQTK